MTAQSALNARLTFVLATFLAVFSWQSARVLARLPSLNQQNPLNPDNAVAAAAAPPAFSHDTNETSGKHGPTVDALLEAIDVMQGKYFDVGTGTWPDSSDWTAAVLGTHISASLSTLLSSGDYTTLSSCSETLAWDNLINRYFSQTSIFYFGQNALSLRYQAYDDMLWVVLGWLENVKLMDLYSSLRPGQEGPSGTPQSWYGAQFKPAVAHRARLFYDLASHGWDTSLCGGGMIWSPHLRPYKNSITNELFVSASISMYLYFPGDDNDSPFLTGTQTGDSTKDRPNQVPHDPRHLENAIKAYNWLKSSRMTNSNGLYADGFHISGWHRKPDGRIDPGTGKCDDLNTMVFTYNQGVVLTGLRGLWLATGKRSYLEDGHELIESVVAATGFPDRESLIWQGLGRGGVLEEYCDSGGGCNQDAHAFKGIFFNHLAEFCRDLWRGEEESLPVVKTGADEGHGGAGGTAGFDRQTWEYHLYRCEGYGKWVEHNAQAAVETRDEDGRFGMWWGRPYPDDGTGGGNDSSQRSKPPPSPSPPALPPGAIDYVNGDASADFTRGGRFATAGRLLPSMGDRQDVNDRGRGRTVETQSGGVAVLRALRQWESFYGKPERE